MTLFLRLAACLAVIAAPRVFASDWYLVGNVGESTFHDIEQRNFTAVLRRSLAPAGPPNDTQSDPFGVGPVIVFDPSDAEVERDKKDVFWRIGGGVQLNDYLAVEAAYLDAGKASIDTRYRATFFTSVPDLLLLDDVSYDASGIEVSALLQYPILDNLQVLGRVGAVYVKQETTRRVGNNLPALGPLDAGRYPVTQNRASSSDQKHGRPVLGVGLQYQVLEALALRLEWMRYVNAIDVGAGHEDLDSLSLGMRFTF
ncbi:MAG: outer membrane beta-barrel protein [Pseudomonadota bacterium]